MADRDPSTGRFAVGNRTGGRTKGWSTIAKLVAEATDDGAELVDFALATFRDTSRPHAERAAAHAWLSDRGFGKPVQATEIYAEVTAGAVPMMPVEVGALPLEDRIAWVRLNAPGLLGDGS